MTGDFTGREAMDSPTDEPDTTVWCAGGVECKPHSKTVEGRKLYNELKQRYNASQDSNKGEEV